MDAGNQHIWTFGIPVPTTDPKPSNLSGLPFLIIDEVLFTTNAAALRPEIYFGFIQNPDNQNPEAMSTYHCLDQSNLAVPFADIRFFNPSTFAPNATLQKIIRTFIFATGNLQHTWTPNLLCVSTPFGSAGASVAFGIIIWCPVTSEPAAYRTSVSIRWREPSIR
jgi:hypothetical protein